MNVAICDNQKECISNIKKYIVDYFCKKNIEIKIFEFENAVELTKSKTEFDIAFLDVEMPGMSGIEAGKILKQKNDSTIIYIVTSFNTYLDDAFDIKAFRFFSKPIDVKRLNSSLDTAIELLDNMVVNIMDNKTDKLMRIPVNDVVCVEICGRKTLLVTKQGEFYSKEKISFWKEKLSPSYFAYPHASYIVNLNYVSNFERQQLTINCCGNEFFVPVASKKQHEFRQIFFNYISKGC